MRPGFYDRYGYADYAWVALDAGAIEPALENLDRFREGRASACWRSPRAAWWSNTSTPSTAPDADTLRIGRGWKARCGRDSTMPRSKRKRTLDRTPRRRTNSVSTRSEGRMTEAHGLRDAYDQLEHEVVECSPSLSVPVSTPAQFAYADTPGVTDAEAIADRIADSPIAFLDVSTTNGDAWYEFHVSGSAYDDDNGGGCTATITTVGVTFVRSNRHLPRESFERIVEAIADAVDAPLRFDDHAENTPGQS